MRLLRVHQGSLPLLTAASLLLCCICTTRADYATTVLSHSPVGYWRLNETGPVPPAVVLTNRGSLGTVQNGSPVAGAVLGAAGVLPGNTAVAVVGNARASIPYDVALNPESFSAEGWFKPNAVVSTTCAMAQFVEGTRSGWLVYQVAGGWSFRLYNQNGTTFSLNITTTTAPVTNQWHHIVVTYDSTTMTGTIYVNGVATTATATGYVPNVSNPFTVGARSDVAFGWDGTADEAAIYAGVLSADKVAAHYAAATTNAAGYATQILADNPLGYWRLDEAAYVPLVAANTGTSGSANNGAYSSTGSTSAVPGPQSPAFAGMSADNKAAAFDGTVGSVDIPALNLTTDRLTMTAWVNRNGLQSAWDGIVMNRNSAGNACGIDISDANGKLAMNWEDTEWGWDYAPENLTLPDGQWTFVAMVVDPTTDTLYMSDPGNTGGYSVNGLAKKVFAPVVNNIKTLDGRLAIGQDPPPQGGRFFGGSIDEVAIFNKTLTEGEILTLYFAATGTNPPIILTQPVAPTETIYSGNTFVLTVDAAGTPDLSYQWRKGGTPISGATLASYTKFGASTADDGSYDVVVSNAHGSVTSSAATISVSPVAAPTITAAMSPAQASRVPGGSITWSVSADGSSPYTYIWRKGTTVLAAHTTNDKTNTFTLSGLVAGDAGTYSVTVTNVAGSVSGGTATLSLLSASAPGFAGAMTALGPYAWWRLDETSGTTAYEVVSGRDATPANALQAMEGPRPPTAVGLEAANNAYEFIGSGSEVILPPLNLAKNEATLTCWVYRLGDQPDYAGLVYYRGAGTSAGLSITDDNRPAVTWADDWFEWGNCLLGLQPLPDNAWAFLAMVVETNQITLYMDDGNGLRSGTLNTAYAPVTKTNTFAGTGRIAHDSGSASGRFFVGRVDEVAVFARPLTPAQVQTIADAGWSSTTTAPRVRVQPVSQTNYVGGTIELAAGASGSSTKSYQWMKGANPVAGATTSTLKLVNLATTDAGNYTVVVSNALGTATSTAATVDVRDFPGGISGYRKLIFADHPIAYYPMDDLASATTIAEVYNFGLDDAAAATPPMLEQTGATTNTATSALFNGYEYALIGNPDALNFRGPISFEAWIKPTDTRPGAFGNIIAHGYGGYYSGEGQLRINNGFYDFQSYSDASGTDGVSVGVPSGDVGQWVHLAGVFDGTSWLLYRNGAQAAISVDDYRFAPITESWAIGARFDGSRAFSGNIDEVAIYNYALSSFQVTNHYYFALTGKSLARSISISRSGADVVITFEGGSLESANDVTGPWAPVPGATSPWRVAPSEARKFFRVP